MNSTGLQIPSKNVVKTDKLTDNYGLEDATFCTIIFMLGTDATRLNLTEPTRELTREVFETRKHSDVAQTVTHLLRMAPRVRTNAAK